MKNKYKIVTDSCADVNLDMIKKYDLEVLPFEITMGEETFMHYPDFREMSFETFYNKLKDGYMASTSQITPFKYVEYLEPLLKAGEDVLYICFSSGLSGSYQSSLVAVNELREKYPQRKIVSIDSLSACGGETLLVYDACINREQGMSLELNAEWLEANKKHIAHQFTVETLTYLWRGGRVSKTTAVVGDALKIKPILHVDDEGHLGKIGQAHGRRKSIKTLVDNMKKTVIDPQNQVIFISYGAYEEDAQLLKHKVEKEFHPKEVILCKMGPVVGTHGGPGILTLFFFASKR